MVWVATTAFRLTDRLGHQASVTPGTRLLHVPPAAVLRLVSHGLIVPRWGDDVAPDA
jgi:hypothetical protein